MTQLQPFYRGDDLTLQACVRHQDTQQPIDVSGWQFDSTMKLSSALPDHPELNEQGYRQVMTTTTLAGGDEARQGLVSLLFRSTQTAQLLVAGYSVDIQVVIYDAVQTIFDGRIQVLADVTRKGAP